ncbi:MAG: hypothetical protein M3O70_05570 [Actinomycetota bacterium]|nr:hypothetical protein [Actinomycetota bacterium]
MGRTLADDRLHGGTTGLLETQHALPIFFFPGIQVNAPDRSPHTRRPRQTRRYDRARGALDHNPTCIVTTYVAGATGAQ